MEKTPLSIHYRYSPRRILSINRSNCWWSIECKLFSFLGIQFLLSYSINRSIVRALLDHRRWISHNQTSGLVCGVPYALTSMVVNRLPSIFLIILPRLLLFVFSFIHGIVWTWTIKEKACSFSFFKITFTTSSDYAIFRLAGFLYGENNKNEMSLLFSFVCFSDIILLCSSLRLFFLQTSWAFIVFSTRTFSNTIESLCLSLALLLLCMKMLEMIHHLTFSL